MAEFRIDIVGNGIEEMLALAFIEDPRTRKDAVELILERPVTSEEMAEGDLHDIITTGMDEGNDPAGTVWRLKTLKELEHLRSNKKLLERLISERTSGK